MKSKQREIVFSQPCPGGKQSDLRREQQKRLKVLLQKCFGCCLQTRKEPSLKISRSSEFSLKAELSRRLREQEPNSFAIIAGTQNEREDDVIEQTTLIWVPLEFVWLLSFMK